MYTTQTKQFNNLKDSIIDEVEANFDEMNEKLDSIQEAFNTKITSCNNKIKDLLSLQNKINEITKMNNQSILNQFNQYEEDNDDIDESTKNQIFNSLENSIGAKNHKKNCFVKINQVNNKENFYMSPRDNLSTTSKNEQQNSNNELQKELTSHTTKSSSSSNSSDHSISQNLKNNQSSKSQSSKSQNHKSQNSQSQNSKSSKKSINIEKNNIDENKSNVIKLNSKDQHDIIISEQIFVQNLNFDKDTENSTLLEITGDFIKTNYIGSNTPKATRAYKILNESSNILFNSSNDLFNLNNKSDLNVEKMSNIYINSNEDSKSEQSDFSDNDPEIIINNIINKKIYNNNKIIEIK